MSVSGENTESAPQLPRRSRAVVVLSVLVGLFAIGAGVFGALFVVEQNKHAETTSQVEAKDRADADANAKLLTAEQKERKATQDSEGLKGTVAELTKCTGPAKDMVRAAIAQNEAAAEAAITGMVLACK